jgi:hypothetical protein
MTINLILLVASLTIVPFGFFMLGWSIQNRIARKGWGTKPIQYTVINYEGVELQNIFIPPNSLYLYDPICDQVIERKKDELLQEAKKFIELEERDGKITLRLIVYKKGI